MAWTTPTEDQVFPKGSKERASIAAVKGVDDLAQVLTRTVDLFRNTIASRGHDLDQPGTVPLGVLDHVVNMALWTFVSVGVPKNEDIQTDTRRKAAEAAQKCLDQIRTGDLAIEPPTGWANNRGGKAWIERMIPGRMGRR